MAASEAAVVESNRRRAAQVAKAKAEHEAWEWEAAAQEAQEAVDLAASTRRWNESHPTDMGLTKEAWEAGADAIEEAEALAVDAAEVQAELDGWLEEAKEARAASPASARFQDSQLLGLSLDEAHEEGWLPNTTQSLLDGDREAGDAVVLRAAGAEDQALDAVALGLQLAGAGVSAAVLFGLTVGAASRAAFHAEEARWLLVEMLDEGGGTSDGWDELWNEVDRAEGFAHQARAGALLAAREAHLDGGFVVVELLAEKPDREAAAELVGVELF